jgi:hypothetical protein
MLIPVDPIGHFSPIGNFDPDRNEVVIYDVDPEYEDTPYVRSLEELTLSMCTQDTSSQKNRGYIVLHLDKTISQ